MSGTGNWTSLVGWTTSFGSSVPALPWASASVQMLEVVVQHLVLVRGGPAEGRPLGVELLLDPVGHRRRAALLEGHAGRAEAGGRHRVAVTHEEEVVGRVVEVALGGDVPAAGAVVAEAGLVGRADPVDPVHRLAGDLVVDRVGVGREEVLASAHLVRVDEDLRRVLPQIRSLPSVSCWVRANQSRFMSKPNSFCRRLASRPSGFWVGTMTVTRLSLRFCDRRRTGPPPARTAS